MSEGFSAVHISGDLGQALATAGGATYLFDCNQIREADTRDIQIFFGAAAEIEELPSFMLERLDTKGVRIRLAESADRATALHNFLMGMDESLSKGLRREAIAACASHLRDPDTYGFLRERILHRLHEGQWDGAGAAVLATNQDAFRPALLYRAIADEGVLGLLQSRDEDWWWEDPRQTYYAILPKGELISTGYPARRDAMPLPVVLRGEYQAFLRLDDELLRLRDLIDAPEVKAAHSRTRKRAIALFETRPISSWSRYLEDTIALYLAALGETPRDCRVMTTSRAAESLQLIYRHSDWDDSWPLEPQVIRAVRDLLEAHSQMIQANPGWIELHHRLTGPEDFIQGRDLLSAERVLLEKEELSARLARARDEDDTNGLQDPISPSLRAMVRATAALIEATPWYVPTAAAAGVAIASIGPSAILGAISVLVRLFQ